MNDIREQIEQLRMQAGISGYHSLMASAADTMERLLAVVEAAKDVYEWADPSSELQQVEMLLLHDAMNAVHSDQRQID